MTALIRFCPNCQTERPLDELFCEGFIGGKRCEWNLSDEPIHPEGWRPQVVVTVEGLPSIQSHVVCVNGHSMDAADLICTTCGADVISTQDITGVSSPQGQTTGCAEEESEPDQETVVDGWRLIRQLSSNPRVRDRYFASHVDSGREAILTLYQHGSEPDTSVYDAVRRLSLEHVPEILQTGRWNERAYEITEYINGGALEDLGIVVTDLDAIRRIVRELGQALHTFTEVGLRHRDIRPGTLLVRNREPLDLVIAEFGSARLSDFDLDIVSPLEVTRYMAPEAIAGGVAAASDWWSLGMVLLEQITRGECFAGINERAFLIHVLASGVTLPENLDPALDLLLRGLLSKDRHHRWQWKEVRAWLNGEAVAAPPRHSLPNPDESGAVIRLGTKSFRQPAAFALAAAEPQSWDQARDHLVRGVLMTWAQEAQLSERTLASMRQVLQHEALHEDFRLMLVLKILNPEMPLIHRGDILTPRWLLDHPLEGYELISGTAPDLLEYLGQESWLSRLKVRAGVVRERAKNLGIELDEDALRINVLSTSRARLSAVWEERRRLLPDSSHHSVLSIMERTTLSEEDLIMLLSANIGLYRSRDVIIKEAAVLAQANEVVNFSSDQAEEDLSLPRLVLTQKLSDRLAGFVRCSIQSVDEWADQFRLERRIPLAQMLVLLAVPEDHWQEPQKQQYIARILEFFEKRVSAAVMRGPLVRMTIGKSTARVDLAELGTLRAPASALLDHLLQRGPQAIPVDPSAFLNEGTAEARLHSLARHANLYKRDTGIDGLYLGFPFLLAKDSKGSTKTRIAPLMLWPVKVCLQLGSRGQVTLSFDNDREEVRLNPALEVILGAEATKKWRQATDELLGRSSLKSADVMDAFGLLAQPRSRTLMSVPGPNTILPMRTEEIECAAALFHVTFTGQAIGEELRQLRATSPAGTGLETVLRLNTKTGSNESIFAIPNVTSELDRYFTASSDPSQEAAVLQARSSPGVLVEGPPGTGKSQTIVNMVGDAIGRKKSLLIICQKHAALEVVHKRLIAEGLGDRVVMINDVNKDRMPIIRAVREQLEKVHRSRDDWSASVRRRRESIAARIESLEGEIDRHHEALHRIVERIGISYRGLLGDLIELETPTVPIELPALRPRLKNLGTGDLASLEEEIAPLVRHWLPARFEGSALVVLQAFAPDKATLEDFRHAFHKFETAERVRSEVLLARPAEFEVEDPAPHKTWLATYGLKLLDLADQPRELLARWLPLFRSINDSPARGPDQVAELAGIKLNLEKCNSQDYHEKISPELAMLAAPSLNSLTHVALNLVTPASWFGRISLIRFLKRLRVKSFLRSLGVALTPLSLIALHKACVLEQQWRPLRESLAKAHTDLQLPKIEAKAGPTLVVEAAETLKLVTEVADLADNLAAAPWSDKVDVVALQGQRVALLKLFATFEAAFARFEVRKDSMQALALISSWMTPEWNSQCQQAITSNEPNQGRLGPLEASLPTLAAYQHFRARAQRLSVEALIIFSILRSKEEQLREIPEDKLDREVRRILNREAFLGWKRELEQENPDLLLDRAELESKVDSLAKLDQEIRDLNREILKADIDLRSIRSISEWDDITRLTGQRARRLREFIEQGAGLGLMQLRPVWLMNPDVASRVLPLKSAFFDTVIYDEASQMPVEHALPTLFRGRVCVVSGDEKQMPPTSFFSSKIESDEAEAFDGELPDEDATEEEREVFEDTWNRREIKDCPDLLQLARSTLPNATLQIHYRSAYRELINFSNACFYGNHLNVPVRHPESTIRAKRPIQVFRTDSVYLEQTNPGEAAKVVDVLAQLWKRPYADRPSIGVVTFNRKQADLIEELLEKRAEEDSQFMQAYSQERERMEQGEDMSVFVKNVENVQGDERDIIVFSSTFGRNSQGTFRRSFGVLGQKGGERRLNVAVTRARKKVVMVTSMPIGEISDLLTTHRTPATPRDFLQGYMEYARAVSSGEFEVSSALLKRLSVMREGRMVAQLQQSKDGFSASVEKFIRELGFDIATSNDQDVFGLDFAIEHPETKLFAIGIECDAPRHELLKRARAREVWRPSVLRRALPCMHRVSSHGWYHNPSSEKLSLRNAIEVALSGSEKA